MRGERKARNGAIGGYESAMRQSISSQGNSGTYSLVPYGIGGR